MATASDYITGALRLIGIVNSGGSPTSAETADGLLVLNELIDSMGTSRLLLHSTQTQTFTWGSGNASRTLGASGDFSGTRPIAIDKSTYYTDPASGLTYNPTFISEEEYNAHPLKTQTSPYPTELWVNMTYPNVTLTVYPVPTMDLSWKIVSVVEMTQPALSGTTIAVPPGYKKFLRYNLAVMLAAEFGMEAPPTVQRIAASSSRAIKRLNKPDMKMMPSVPVSGVKADIYAGY